MFPTICRVRSPSGSVIHDGQVHSKPLAKMRSLASAPCGNTNSIASAASPATVRGNRARGSKSSVKMGRRLRHGDMGLGSAVRQRRGKTSIRTARTRHIPTLAAIAPPWFLARLVHHMPTDCDRHITCQTRISDACGGIGPLNDRRRQILPVGVRTFAIMNSPPASRSVGRGAAGSARVRMPLRARDDHSKTRSRTAATGMPRP